MPKKYMVRCDIEGVTGVVSYEQAEPGRPEYEFGHRMFMADLMALLEGLKAGGADEVVIYDEHYYGRNIDISQLPYYASAICGKPPYRSDWAGGLDSGFSGLVLLGFHSKAETPDGLLPHSYELDIRDLRLNGVSVGEIGMEAAIAGDYGVPTVLVVGDSAGVREALQLIPGVVGVSVKEAASASRAVCSPFSVTSKAIFDAASSVAGGEPAAKPFRIEGDVTLEIVLAEGPYLDMARKLYDRDLWGGSTMIVTGGNVTEVWAKYWQRKLRCQAEVLAAGKEK